MALENRMVLNREAFTASIPHEEITANRYIDQFTLALQGDMTTGTPKTVAQMLALMSNFQVRRAGSVIIDINAEDLYAMNQLFLKHNPFASVAGIVTDDKTTIQGLRLPMWQPPANSGNLDFSITRTAVAGIDTELISVMEESSNKILKPFALQYVTQLLTTSGATGFGNIIRLPQTGDLLGILFRSATIPTTSSNIATLQGVKLKVDGFDVGEREWFELRADGFAYNDLLESPADASIIDNYVLWDFRKDPITIKQKAELDINAGVASSSIRAIPIYAIRPRLPGQARI